MVAYGVLLAVLDMTDQIDPPPGMTAKQALETYGREAREAVRRSIKNWDMIEMVLRRPYPVAE